MKEPPIPAAATGDGLLRTRALLVRPLILRLDSNRTSLDELRKIHEITKKHPGKVPLHLSILDLAGKRVHFTTAIEVALGNGLVEELRPWM